ncbi:unnamed protein product, partial [Musa textilis]
ACRPGPNHGSGSSPQVNPAQPNVGSHGLRLAQPGVMHIQSCTVHMTDIWVGST